MDLFSDLPAPTSDCTKPSATLFDDLPPAKKVSAACDCTQPSATLFDDLPPAKKDSAEPSSVGGKRKIHVEKDVQTTEDVGEANKTALDLYKLKGFEAERKGEREDMQDAFIIRDDFTNEVQHLDPTICRLAYYGVFDGHRGSRASKHAAENLHTVLAKRFPKGDLKKVESDIKKCFIETFKETDEMFLKKASKMKPSWKDGSTAVTVLVINNTLYIANLGDSKAILCRYNEEAKKYTALPLTKDHSPTLYEERMRIQKAGGHVRDGRVMGILEVSRSIGDGPYKQHGVTCLPDVKRCQLTDKDRFLLIACDGVWKRFDSQSGVDFINKCLENASLEIPDHKDESDFRYDTACSRLAAESVRKLSGDNVTVIIVSIGPLSHR